MGFWGVKSYENDLAQDSLDTGFDRTHGKRYEELMDDRNPLPYDKVQEQLANAETLSASLSALAELSCELTDESEDDPDLAFAGIVVRHVECKVEVPEEIVREAITHLEQEDMEWPRPTDRKLRVERELTTLRRRLPE